MSIYTPKSISVSMAVIANELFVRLKTVLVSRTHDTNIYTNQIEWELKDDNGYILPQLTSGKLCKFILNVHPKLNSLICFCLISYSWIIYIFAELKRNTEKCVGNISKGERSHGCTVWMSKYVMLCTVSGFWKLFTVPCMKHLIVSSFTL